jgi:hypothetical protein
LGYNRGAKDGCGNISTVVLQDTSTLQTKINSSFWYNDIAVYRTKLPKAAYMQTTTGLTQRVRYKISMDELDKLQSLLYLGLT